MGIRATINLLNASAVVAISGGLRLYVAFLLVRKEPDISLSIASTLIVYATYTLDRTLKSKEDEINRKEEENANKNLALFMVCVSSVTAVLILIQDKIFPFIAVFPFTMGYIYGKGIKFGRYSLKLKQGLGIKNCVVAFIWASTIIAFIYPAERLNLFLVFIFFFVKSFINTVLFDCRDVKGDLQAGLATIPVCFGEAKTMLILQILHSSFHLSVMVLTILNIVKFELIILLYSWIGGIIYILLYTNSKKTIFRDLLVHGEWAHMLMFRNLAIQLS